MNCVICGAEIVEGTVCEKCHNEMADKIRHDRSPCKSDCLARAVGCHSICQYYQEYKEFHEFVKSQQAPDRLIYDYKGESKRRCERKYGVLYRKRTD